MAQGQETTRDGRGDQVAAYLVTEVPTTPPSAAAGMVRAGLAGRRYADASHVYLVQASGQYEGTIRMTDLLAAADDTPVRDLVQPGERLTVTPLTDRESAATLAIRSQHSALAVVADDGRFLGAIAARALLSILRDEHIEDLHQMAGILARSERARAALLAPPFRRGLFRLPWLLVGLAGSALATGIMASFEAALAQQVAVAFFVPAIVYLADAVGTQSEAVAVRGLSLVDGHFARLLFGEVGTGVFIGAVLSLCALPLVWLGFQDWRLAGSVAAALFAASSCATTVGFLLPWVFERLGLDPADGSGPLATVIQDVLSILVYLVIATRLVLAPDGAA